MSRRRIANPCPIIIDRQAAADSGRTRFYTGRPCKHGHMAERFVSGGGCVECVNPVIRACGPHQEFFPVRVLIESPLSGEQRNELERLMQGWASIKLREWGIKST